MCLNYLNLSKYRVRGGFINNINFMHACMHACAVMTIIIIITAFH